MNKTLLIIICDFLLISVLALVEFKPNVEVEAVDQQVLKQQAAEEMLELLQLSLEHENAQREEVEAALGQTREELDQTKNELEDTSSTLEEVNQNLNLTEAERAALAESLQNTKSTLQLTLEEKANLQESLQQNQAQSRQLQEELRTQQALASERSAALAKAEENLQNLETQQQQMSTEMKILGTEKEMLQQNLVTARAEVERARLEAERAQARSESLASGVSELAASSEALKEEIRNTQPLSLNAIYKQFEDNRVLIAFNWKERSFLSSIEKRNAIQTMMVDTGNGIFAIFATANTPFSARNAEDINARMKIGQRTFTISEIGFMAGEPGIAAVQVPRDVAAASGLSVFTLSEEPLKYSTAVVVNDDQEAYGETPVRVPPGEDGYLEIESRLFNRMFGDFSPGAGDYVFSMTGQLTGIMVRSNRARILRAPQFGGYRQLAGGN